MPFWNYLLQKADRLIRSYKPVSLQFFYLKMRRHTSLLSKSLHARARAGPLGPRVGTKKTPQTLYASQPNRAAWKESGSWIKGAWPRVGNWMNLQSGMALAAAWPMTG